MLATTSLVSGRSSFSGLEIKERLCRLDPKLHLLRRDKHRWSVFMPFVMVSIEGGGARSFEAHGTTKYKALQAAWDLVLEYSISPRFLLRHNCTTGVDLYNRILHQMWVRWDLEEDNWKDVPPTGKMRAARGTPLELIDKISQVAPQWKAG